MVKKTKSRILVLSIGKRVHAVDNTCWDGERGKGTLFDAASGAEFEKTIETLEVYC